MKNLSWGTWMLCGLSAMVAYELLRFIVHS